MKIILINLDIPSAENIFSALKESDKNGWTITGFSYQKSSLMGNPFDLIVSIAPKLISVFSVSSSAVFYSQKEGTLRQAIAVLKELYPRLDAITIVGDENDHKTANNCGLPYLSMEQFVKSYEQKISVSCNKMLELQTRAAV